MIVDANMNSTPLNKRILSVSELTFIIKELLETNLDFIIVEGEISNVRRPKSGHYYFTLKDEQAQISCVLFRQQRLLIRFEPEDGLSIICRGRLNVYEPRGTYQIIIDYMEPKGMGAWQLAFEQLKKKLADEGLFDQEKKRKIPFLPRKVGLITSISGAAIRDFLNIQARRFPNVELIIFPARVQGERAHVEIIEGLKILGRETEVEVIVIARGGGSIEDLMPFNEESLARAIASSPVPVISAIGHEIDYTIADFVSDLRAPTPSAAAEMLFPLKRELIERVYELKRRLFNLVLNLIDIRKEELNRLNVKERFLRHTEKAHIFLDEIEYRLENSIEKLIREKKTRFRILNERFLSLHPVSQINGFKIMLISSYKALLYTIKVYLKEKRSGIEEVKKYLSSLSPLNVLSRGYAIVTRNIDGTILTSVNDIEISEKVKIELMEGRLRCMVEDKWMKKEE